MRTSALFKRRSLEEIRFRLGQISRILVERCGIIPGRTEADALALTAPELPFANAKHAAAVIAQRWPSHRLERIASAEAILAGRIPLLGFESSMGNEPDRWRTDPVTGQVAPRKHWSQMPYLDLTIVGDHKRVWELNRHQHLLVLGQAYALTGDQRFAARAIDDMESWIASNPPAIGMNWTSALELSMRSIVWLWTLHLLGDCALVTDICRQNVVRSLSLQLLHVEANLSYYFSANTHLTGEALALVYAGVAFGTHPIGVRWQQKGQAILQRELMHQLRPDGTYFEQSSWYQRYTVDFGMHFLALVGKSVIDVNIRERLTRATDVLRWISRPDLTLPLFGDDDGGTLLPLEARASSRAIGATLALAAVLNHDERARSLVSACTPSVAWLLGAHGVEQFESMAGNVSTDRSHAFPDGGLYIARSSWANDANVVILDGGPHGDGAHGHADALSVELVLDGIPVLVDAGTLTYVGIERDSFRSTRAHNTVVVGDRSSSEPNGLFGWANKTDAVASRWKETSDQSGMEWSASHASYVGGSSGVLVHRSVLWLNAGLLVVSDLVESVGGATSTLPIEVGWQFDTGWHTCETTASSVTLRKGQQTVGFSTAGAAAHLRVEGAIVSDAYGAANSALRVSSRSQMLTPKWHLLSVFHSDALLCVDATASVDLGRATLKIESPIEIVDIVLVDDDSLADSIASWSIVRRSRTQLNRDANKY